MALIPAILANAADLYAFTSFTFESPTTGRTGPTLSQILSYYASSKGNPSWAQNSAYLNMTTQGIQRWTVPATRIIRATARSGGQIRFSPRTLNTTVRSAATVLS